MDLETTLTLSIAAVSAVIAALTFWTNARDVDPGLVVGFRSLNC